MAWGSYPGGTVGLVELTTGRERHRFSGREGGVRSLAFSADGTRLLSCHWDTTAVL